MANATVLLAEGFEEVEAITVVDVLRRAGVDANIAGVGGTTIKGGHDIRVQADIPLDPNGALPEAVILPGGLGGSKNLAASDDVRTYVLRQHHAGKLVAAICAAPAVVLAPFGVLAGKRATCYPGFEQQLGADVQHVTERVVVDGNVVTSQGPGTAAIFALKLVALLASSETATELSEGMLIP